MIDLSQFVDKNVTVIFRDGTTTEGVIGFNHGNYNFPYWFEAVDDEIFSYTDAGRYFVTKEDRRDIVAIEEAKEVEPAVDLSEFAGKFITATLRNGDGVTSRLKTLTGDFTSYPYLLANETYTRDGRFSKTEKSPEDIVAVEEVVPVRETVPEGTTEVNYKQQVMQIGTILGEAFPECDITAVDMARLVMDQLKTLRMAAGLPTFDQVRNQTNS